VRTSLVIFAVCIVACGPVETLPSSVDRAPIVGTWEPAPPEDHNGLSFIASSRADDAAPLAFMLEYDTPDPHLPELDELPGLPARAHALRWEDGQWIEIEVRPTTAEACEALGICALDAAKDLCSRLPRDGEDLGE
jgi:hypothetical protein